jgi:hypothetical protein
MKNKTGPAIKNDTRHQGNTNADLPSHLQNGKSKTGYDRERYGYSSGFQKGGGGFFQLGVKVG